MRIEVNNIVYLRVKALGVLGNTLNATIYDHLGNVFTTKVMNRVGTLNIFQTSQVFTTDGSYFIKADDFEFYQNIEVVNSVSGTKNNENEIHAWLDSYANKDDFKADTTTITANQNTINEGIKKTSLRIPHNNDLS